MWKDQWPSSSWCSTSAMLSSPMSQSRPYPSSGSGDEPVAVLGEEAHGQQGCFQAVSDLDFPLYLAAFLADELLAAAEDDQAERLGVVIPLMGVYGIVVVAAAGKQQQCEKG